jgi:hypothetical protein
MKVIRSEIILNNRDVAKNFINIFRRLIVGSISDLTVIAASMETSPSGQCFEKKNPVAVQKNFLPGRAFRCGQIDSRPTHSQGILE